MSNERPRAGPLKPPPQSPRDLRRNLRLDPREEPGHVPDQDAGEAPVKAPRPERQVAFRTGISAESRAGAFHPP